VAVSITATKNTRQVLIDLGDHDRRFRVGIREGLYELGRITQDEIVRLITTGPRTGRTYKRPGRPDHIASAPGEPPANDTGALAAGVDYVVRDLEMEIGDTVPYGVYLELGTRRMRGERPHLILGVNNTAGDGVVILGDRVHRRVGR
jgi:hypothetical protein